MHRLGKPQRRKASRSTQLLSRNGYPRKQDHTSEGPNQTHKHSSFHTRSSAEDSPACSSDRIEFFLYARMKDRSVRNDASCPKGNPPFDLT